MASNSSFPVIIDTDPGIDDALALYLALSSPQLDIKGITLVFGNTSINHVTRNLVTLFDVIDKEIEYLKTASPPSQIDPNEWEKERKILLNRFEWSKPIVAIGVDKPIKALECLGIDFHGLDGFGQIHTTHPHYAPENWEGLKSNRYTKSSRNAIDEILYQLENSPPFTITIIGLGPLTNLALAYEKDKHTFSRVKQIICLGGAIACGNVTPCAEFNFFADPDAASILVESTKGFSLSENVQNKIERLNRKEVLPLHFTVLPIDVSSKVFLSSTVFTKYITSLNTPLSVFVSIFIDYAFKKTHEYLGAHGLELHDPLAIALAIDVLSNNSQMYTSKFVDMKVEYQGIYTRGMTIVDKRQEFSNDVDDELSQKAHEIWSTVNANNVELINSYNYESFISNFFKITFNVKYP
ncbi:Inosine/uridine-preferring nucleoside hydrolase domain-containing protein [Glomus cerebriforme]|uniref:Inosine/uridine-preferring nucleoside hydrolase domain-containing protein n=1 Tax=Glomus cerebriforme TaxID=658196 RepID=A0A397T840_9GLOM|nr:Inosine/uridine-preferring nucleoside hydrolase domain-containing protein [Glomus cerebriforme]